MELRIALTLVFVAAGVFCLRRAVTRSGAGDRIGYAAHALMSASMVAMAWFPPRWVAWQVAVFAVAGGHFAVRAVGVSPAALRLSPVSGPLGAVPAAGTDQAIPAAEVDQAIPAAEVDQAIPAAGVDQAIPAAAHGRGARARCLHHALVMAAMAWMLHAMTPGAASMPGMRGSRTPFSILAAVGGVYCLTTAALLLAAWIVTATRNTANPHDDLVHASMTAGMGAMLLTISVTAM